MNIASAAATTLQILATALFGLMAGFFFAVSIDLVPAMLALEPQNYLSARQAMHRVLHEIPFAMVYFGAVLVPLCAALALWLCGQTKEAQLWFVIAIVYLIGVFLLTGEITIPINDALAQWESQAAPAYWMPDRDQLDRANLLRCITACVSFAAALAALAWRPRPEPPSPGP